MSTCDQCGSLTGTAATFCASCGWRIGSDSRWRAWAVPRAALRHAVLVGAVALAVVLALLTILTASLDLALRPAGDLGPPVDWFRAGVLSLGLAVRAPVQADLAAGLSFLGVELEASLVAVPLVITAGLVLVVALVARRSRLSAVGCRPLTLVTLGAVAAGAFSFGAALVAVLATGPVSALAEAGAQVELGAAPLPLLMLSFPLALGSLLLGLVTRSGPAERALRQRALDALGSWGRDVRHALVLAAATLGTAVVVGSVALLWEVVANVAGGSDAPEVAHLPPEPLALPTPESLDGRGIAMLGTATLLLLPQVLVYAGGTVLGGSLGATAEGELSALSIDSGTRGVDRTVGLLAGGLPPVAYLVPLVVLAVVLAVGTRFALHEPPSVRPGDRWWRVGAVHAGIWASLALLTVVSAELSGRGSILGGGAGAVGRASAGLGLPSTIVMAFAWGVAAVVVARSAVRRVSATFPVTVSRLGGPGMDGGWRLLLADAVVQAGKPMPRQLTAAHSALLHGERPDAERLVVKPGRGRLVVAVASGLAASSVALVVAHQVLSSTMFGPQRVVTAYFEALQQGDAEAALDLVHPSTLEGAAPGLLRADVIRDAAVEADVGEVSVEGDSATVAATVDGRPAQLVLYRDGRSAGVFPRWRLGTSFDLLHVQVDAAYGAPVESVRVNGVEMPATDAGVLVFPGRYSVSVPAAYPWAGRDAEVVAVGGSTVTAAPSVALAPDVPAKADAAVRAHVDRCAESTSSQPPQCPFSWYSALGEVEWRVLDYPTVVVDAGDGASLRVRSDDPGEVRLSGVDADSFFGPQEVEQDNYFWVAGSLRFDTDGQPVFVPDS